MMNPRLNRALALDALRVRTEEGNVTSTAEEVRRTAEEILPERFGGYVEGGLFSLGAINRARKALGLPLKLPIVGLGIYSALTKETNVSRAEGRQVQRISNPDPEHPDRRVPAFTLILEEVLSAEAATPELSSSE